MGLGLPTNSELFGRNMHKKHNIFKMIVYCLFFKYVRIDSVSPHRDTKYEDWIHDASFLQSASFQMLCIQTGCGLRWRKWVIWVFLWDSEVIQIVWQLLPFVLHLHFNVVLIDTAIFPERFIPFLYRTAILIGGLK